MMLYKDVPKYTDTNINVNKRCYFIKRKLMRTNFHILLESISMTCFEATICTYVWLVGKMIRTKVKVFFFFSRI